MMNSAKYLILALFAGMMGNILAQSNTLRPNILICIADDWSYPHAGAYGCNWIKTPAFDRGYCDLRINGQMQFHSLEIADIYWIFTKTGIPFWVKRENIYNRCI